MRPCWANNHILMSRLAFQRSPLPRSGWAIRESRSSALLDPGFSMERLDLR
jgi:hypothetical protein